MMNLLKKIMMIASKLIELLRKQISVILYGPSVNNQFECVIISCS